MASADRLQNLFQQSSVESEVTSPFCYNLIRMGRWRLQNQLDSAAHTFDSSIILGQNPNHVSIL